MPRFRDSKLYDLLAVAPLIAWYIVAIRGLAPMIGHDAARFWAGLDTHAGLIALSKAATLAFLALQIVLFMIRRLPERRTAGVMPRLAALIGANLQLVFLALPQVQPGPALALISTGLILTGMAGSILTGFWLGRGFSIFPQARQLVTTGPYRLVRHPLYLAEQIATFGAMLQFAMPWALVVALASLIAQFPRMHYEEAILSEAYPAYRAYTARTRRLVPYLY